MMTKIQTRLALLCPVLLSTIVFVACGNDDSGSTDMLKGPDMSVAAMENLPNCTEKREGETAFVAEDGATYECKNGKWIFGSAPIQTVETQDDLLNCTSKAEGDTVKVISENAIFRCYDGKWEKYLTLTDTLTSVDDLLACVTKREGNTSFITKEHALYRCEDGSWEKTITFMDTVKTKEDLSNCTSKNENDSTYVSKKNAVYLCIDKGWHYLGDVMESSDNLPNCSEKRDGEKSFIAKEHVTLICSDGKWLRYDIYAEIKPEKSPESGSSSKEDGKWEEYGSGSSSSKKTDVTEGTMTDSRDGQTYKTIKIGNLTWMAENLNYDYKVDDKSYSSCIADDCIVYGRGYSVADGWKYDFCPKGWHLPDSVEWQTLYDAMGKSSYAMQAKGYEGWPNATDAYGFSALPTGKDYTGYIFAGFLSSNVYKIWYLDPDSAHIDGGGDGIYAIRCVEGEIVKSSSSAQSSSSKLLSSSSSVKSSSSVNLTSSTILTDSRDGQTYKIVTIGSQTWMAENLNYETANSYCYQDSAKYCTKYGRLYTWAAAMDSAGKWSSNGKGCGRDVLCSPTYPVRGVCPEGWHLPSYDEWSTLFSAVGEQSSAGMSLKSNSGWNDYNGEWGNGYDDFGFSALPAGAGYEGEPYTDYGDAGCFWSSTETKIEKIISAYGMCLYNYDGGAFLHYCGMGGGLSVRCLQD